MTSGLSNQRPSPDLTPRTGLQPSIPSDSVAVKPLKLPDDSIARVSISGSPQEDSPAEKAQSQAVPLLGPHADPPKASSTKSKGGYQLLKEEPEDVGISKNEKTKTDVAAGKTQRSGLLKSIGQLFRNIFLTETKAAQTSSTGLASIFSKKSTIEGRTLYREMSADIPFLKQTELEELLKFCKDVKVNTKPPPELPSFIENRLNDSSQDNTSILQKLKRDCEIAKSPLVLAELKDEVTQNVVENLQYLPQNEAILATSLIGNFKTDNVSAENFATTYEKLNALSDKMEKSFAPPEIKDATKGSIDKLKKAMQELGTNILENELSKGSDDLRVLFTNIESLTENNKKIPIEAQLNILNQCKANPDLISTTITTIKEGSLYNKLSNNVSFLTKSERGELLNFCNALNKIGNPHPPKMPAFIEKYLSDNAGSKVHQSAIKELKRECELARDPFVLAEIKKEITDLLPDILLNLPEELTKEAELTMTDLANFDPHAVNAENFLENRNLILGLGGKIDTLTRDLPLEQKAANRQAVDKLNLAMETLGDHIVENELSKGSKELKELHANITNLAGSGVKIPIDHQVVIISQCKSDPALLTNLNAAVTKLQNEKTEQLKRIDRGEPLKNNKDLFEATNEIVSENGLMTKPTDYLLAISGCFSNSQFLTDTFVVVRDLIGSDDQSLATTGKRYIDNKRISLDSATGRETPKGSLMKDGYLILNQYGLACKVDWNASENEQNGFELGVSISSAFQKPDLSFSDVSKKTLSMELDKELFPEKLDVKTKTGIIKLLKGFCGESTPPPQTTFK